QKAIETHHLSHLYGSCTVQNRNTLHISNITSSASANDLIVRNCHNLSQSVSIASFMWCFPFMLTARF
ncbi:MAG: hypothetical protein NC453_26010, partial [Muribaculum sp.]|nr:hypothetical protein [Muribaculum sp.]